jgi:hypothetical protein
MLDLISRGHNVGGGLISPDGNYFFLSIPKNASVFISNVLHQNKWQYSDLSIYRGQNVFCIVRDPVERWISGIATYIATNILGENYGSEMFIRDYNELVERLIFDNINFDDHTTPQIEFVSLVPANMNIKFFLADKNQLLDNLSQYINYELKYDLSKINENASKNNFDKRNLVNLFQKILNQKYIDKIKTTYRLDYLLLQAAKSYER